MLKNTLFFFFFMLVFSQVNAQDFLIQDGVTENTCSGTFYDTGDASGDFSNNENLVYTICPDDPNNDGLVSILEFTEFDLGEDGDSMTIYDADTADPASELGTFTGNIDDDAALQEELALIIAGSDNASGCLTIEFTSDSSITHPGWEATISCQTLFPIEDANVNECEGIFTDSGGPNADHANDENFIYTICPDDPGNTDDLVAVLKFTDFELENGTDTLTIYDSDTNEAGTELGTFSGDLQNNPELQEIAASDTSQTGCLTIEFTSNNSTTSAGWNAFMSCRQRFVMKDNTVNTCNGTFYDSGGPDEGYESNENFVYTICPDDPDLISVIEFIDFQTPGGTDVLNIYDGDDTTAPQITQLTGTEVDQADGDPSITFSGSEPNQNPSGCLTFEFISDGFLETDGWEANISCREPCPVINASLVDISPAEFDPATEVYTIGQNTDINFSGTANPDSGDLSNLTFSWNFGANDIDGQDITETFPNQGTINATLTVTDDSQTTQVCSETIDFVLEVVDNKIIIDDNYNQDPNKTTLEELVSDVLISGTCSDLANIQSPSNSQDSGQGYNSFGYFESGFSDFVFEEGLVMMSYDVNSIPAGPTGGGGWPGDPDLETLIQEPGNTNDATTITFEFTPFVDEIDFNYIFASYEYPNFVCNFADTFAFILSGPGISDINSYDHDGNPNTAPLDLDLGGLNIATVPGTQNVPVSPVNVHDESCSSGLGEFSFPAFYDAANSEMNNPGDMDITGRTRSLTAQADVIPGQTYLIKLVIADRGDTILNSAVFLEGGSFELGANLGEDITIDAPEAQCEGDPVDLEIFDGNLPVGFNIQWLKDGQPIPGETGATLTVIEGGSYTVDIQAGSNCDDSDTIDIDFIPTPEVQNQNDLDIILCSPFDGSIPTFDLTVNDDKAIGNQNADDFEVSYYPTQTDADNGTNVIADPENYIPATLPETLYLRIENAEGSKECIDTKDFEINTSSSSIANLSSFAGCGDNGSDVASFDLTQNQSALLNGNDINDFNVEYYTSQQDAIDGTNPINDPANFQNTTNPQTIWGKQDNLESEDCFVLGTFEVEVFPTPEIQQTINLNECSVDGQSVDFDLTINNANNMGVADPANTDVSYYFTDAEANNAQNPILSPDTYVLPADQLEQTIYVRAENSNSPDCFSISTFELTIFEVTVNPVDDLNECADGSGTQTAIFDLTENTALALGTQDPDDYSVSYHTSQADADTGANPIPDPTAYQNTNSPQPIWIRVTNDSAPINCYSTDSFSLSVTESAPVNLDPDPIYACDDNNDGFFNNFDLTQRDDDISLGNPDIAVSYHPTQSDAENNLNPLASPYANVVESQQTIYIRAEDTTNGCANTGELELIIVDSPLLETPEPLVGCDVNETGILAFDLTEVEDEVLDGIDPTSVNISYHNSQSDAEDNINPIGAPGAYNNANNPQTVYIRVEDPSSPLNCFNIEPIELQVEPLPNISDPSILEKCDDPTGSGEFDEVATFDLTQKIPEITNNNTDLSVTYYATVADQTNDNPIADPTQFVNTENPQTIEVSVSSSETPCIATTTLTVSVDPLPTIPDPEPLEVCDVDNDGFAEFDLAAEETDILDGEIETVLSFHLTEAEAQAGTNAIDTSNAFSNTNPDNQTIYIRAEKTTTGCFDVKALELIIIPSPEIENLEDLSQCDDGDNNGFAPFDLTQNDSAAIGGQDDTNLSISYHLSQSDAEDDINPIAVPSNFINSLNPQTIYVRLENTETGCLDTFSGTEDTTNSFTITVEPQPQITAPSPLAVCDDDDNQNPFPQVSFDLTEKESEIVGQPNVPDNLSFSYYESQTDLDNNNPIATPEDFTNTVAPPQTILIEVTDTATDNSCKSGTTLTINVLPLPSPSETDPEVLRLTKCDDDRDGIAATPFDLTQSGQLIGESENVTISYYTSENEAEAGEDQGEITTPEAYVNDPGLNIDDEDGNPTNIQIIYARVESGVAGNDCFVIVPFEIIVEPNPVLNPQGDPFGYTLCEDGNSGTAEILSFVDVTNNLFDQSSGDASTIISLLDQDVFPSQELENFTISYHNSESEADNNTNPLSSGYEASDGETLYIRVESNATGCYNIGNIGEVVISIQPRPAIASSVADIEVCADEIGDDQIATIDLTEQDGACDPGQTDGTTVEVIYYEGMMAFNNGTPIEDPQNYTTSQSPQTIIAEVVDTETLCESADTVSFDIEVNPIPVATIAPFDGSVLCIDNEGNIIDNDFSPPVLDSGLAEGPGLTFEWSLDGNILGENGSSITATEPGTYSLTVTDNASPANCSTTSTAEVIQSGPPQFTAEVTTEAFAESHEILVSNIIGIGDYEFRLDNGPWQDLPAGQSSLFFQDVSAGSHQVTGRDKNGCGEFVVPVETLGYPDFFTPNQDGYNDTWNINGLSNRDNVKIYIFDRYGKLLKQLNPDGPGWDGTFNGNNMPSNDYWFNVEYEVQTDSTTTKRTMKDNFTLKR